jgi:hypothetical protein
MSIFDLRARSYCNLGELISWSISDDYAQGNGVIKYRGQLEINSLVRPAIGDPVLIGYEQPGVLALIPRKLRVLSVFCNPAEYITKLDVGCKLTYLEDLKDPEGLPAAYGQPSFTGYESYQQADGQYITVPIQASNVMNYALEKLGITVASSPLTSRFQLSMFTFQDGYVQALGELLKSECYRGFLDENEVLRIVSAKDPAGKGPVITPDQIVAMGPINVGKLPGDAVRVSYSTHSLEGGGFTQSDVADSMEKKRWEKDETEGEPTKSIVQWNTGDDENNPSGQTYSKTWQPVTTTLTTYKTLTSWSYEYGTGSSFGNSYIPGKAIFESHEVKDTVTETRNGILSAGAGNVCGEYLSNGIGFYDREYQSTTETTYEYDSNANEIGNTRITKEPAVVIFGRMGLKWYYDDGGAVPLRYDEVITEKVITETAVVDDSSKTFTTRWLFYPLTQEGQQAVAEARDHFQSAGAVVDFMDYLLRVGLVCMGANASSQTKTASTDKTVIGKVNAIAEGRPSLDKLTTAAHGAKLTSNSKSVWAIGSPTDQRRVDFTLPNVPDDFFAPYTTNGERAYAPLLGYAGTKAVNFGLTENRMLLGHRNGMNVQLPISLVPPYPLDVIYVNANGYMAQYRMNGTHYVGNKDGIVVTSDLMYWAGAKSVDTPAEAWIPTAPGTAGSSLPKVIPATNANPSPANAVAIPTDFDRTDLAALFGAAAGGTGSGILVGGIAPVYETELVNPLVVPPFTLSVDVVGGIGIGASMGQYGYALSVSLDVAPAVIGIGARILENVKMAASAGSASLGLLGARLIYSRRAIELPVSYEITANAAGFGRIYRLSGQSRALAAAFNSAELRKGIVPTYKLAAAAGGYAIAGGNAGMSVGVAGDPDFPYVSLLLNGEAFTDLSANALTITPNGNAAIVAGQGPFGGAAMSFDGQFATLVSVPANGLVLDADFTIEIWVKFASPSSYQYFMASSNDSGYFQMALNGVANNAIGIGRGSIDWPLVFSGHNLQSNAWQFVTVRRSNGVAQCFVGSTQIGSNVNDTTSYIVGPTALYIGHQDSNGTMIGLIGPLRITNGIARTITVPTGPFPTA